jgi:3-oxo-5alpha-steroid 4-dehydrogenase
VTDKAAASRGDPLRAENGNRPLELAEVGTFDLETDVFVAGFGAAGSCAAHAAREVGAEVLVAERASGPGGAAALSEGIVYLGGGTPVQTACGFEDSVDNMERYLLAACGPEPDEAKVVAYAEASLDHFGWLVNRGVEYDPRLDTETQMAPAGTEGLVWSGGEDAWPFNEIAVPAPRGHLAKTKRSTGWLLMQILTGAAITAGADVSYDTRVERLIVDDGRVVGAVATR